jgi:AraC-like DNA-binding protein
MHDEAAEDMKMTELIYLITSQRDCCLKSKVLSNVDSAHDNFEQIIYSNIFSDLAIEELAEMCNRSLTSFKKEFKRHFFMPPHRWFIKQRLIQSRLLLISTSKSISEIGIECTFPNTSHFIKLFKKQYGTTPAIYRNTHCNMDDIEMSAKESNSKEPNKTQEQIESMAI